MTKHLNCVKFHRQCAFLRDFDRLVRLGLPVKCNPDTNEKSESTKLFKKIKLRYLTILLKTIKYQEGIVNDIP